MMHKEIEVYVDDVIIKSKTKVDHVQDLRKFLERVWRYELKLNPAKSAFGVPFGQLLGFIVSRRGIELDPSKIKAIRDLPSPKNKTKVMSLLGRLNYINRFIAQLTTTCEPIFQTSEEGCCCQMDRRFSMSFWKNQGVFVQPSRVGIAWTWQASLSIYFNNR